jgi:hypothetical protein
MLRSVSPGPPYDSARLRHLSREPVIWAFPPRVTIPVGFGFLFGALGVVAGTAFGVHVIGEPIIDGNATIC